MRPDEEPRRHELDALRAFAMLLGVALHALLTFFPWALPSGIRFLLVTGGVSAVLLLSYQAFVRYTPIGTLLNGRKRRPVYG